MRLLISDPEFNLRNRISLCCSAIPILGIPLFFFLRKGFADKYYTELASSAGICLFLLFTPLLVSFLVKRNPFFFKAESLLLWIFLVLLTFLAIVPYSVYIIAVIGVGSFIICFYCFFSGQKLSLQIFALIILSAYFSLWVLFTVWMVQRPTLFETLAVNRKVFQVQDLFFHATISNTIKNYGTPSTGLQGTPYLYYHFGSHWFIARISELTNIHIVRIYNVFYPFVVVPCFFKVFLTFVSDVSQTLKAQSTFSFLSVVFFFCLFLGIPYHWYSKGFFDASILGLESLVFSLSSMFMLGSMWISLYMKKTTFADFSPFEKAFILVISPIIFWTIGLIKISTLFVILGPFSFLILRFNRWTDLVGISFYITVVGSALVYFFVAETIPFGIRTHGHEGDLKLGSVYASMTANELFDPIHWFILFFLWTYLTIAIVLIFKKMRLSWSKELDRMSLSVILLVTVATAVMGLLPSFLFSFNGANAMFFVTIQMFVSGSFLMALAPTIQSAILSNKFMTIPFFALCLGVFLLIHKEIKFTAKEVLLENLNTRTLITDPNEAPKIRFSLNHDLKLIWNGFPDLQRKINRNTLYQVLMNTEKLGNQDDPQRSKTLLFIEDYVNGRPIRGTENLNCLEKSFLVPALSGYAVLNGALYNCSIESYGAAYYDYPDETQDSTRTVICETALAKGFRRILSYNVADNSLRQLECKEILELGN